MHDKQRDYKCQSCGNSFSKKSLKSHVRSVHDEGVNDKECNICSKIFNKQHLLNINVKSSHSSTKTQMRLGADIKTTKWCTHSHQISASHAFWFKSWEKEHQMALQNK